MSKLVNAQGIYTMQDLVSLNQIPPEIQSDGNLLDTELDNKRRKQKIILTTKPKTIEQPIQIRIDSLFKPLFRRFRSYLRNKFDEYHNKNRY